MKLKWKIRWHFNEVRRGTRSFIYLYNLLTEMFLRLKVILGNNLFYLIFRREGVDTNNWTTTNSFLPTLLDITLFIPFSLLFINFIFRNIILRFSFFHSNLFEFCFASNKFPTCLWLFEAFLQERVRVDRFVIIQYCYHRILQWIIAVMICSVKISHFFVHKWLWSRFYRHIFQRIWINRTLSWD